MYMCFYSRLWTSICLLGVSFFNEQKFNQLTKRTPKELPQIRCRSVFVNFFNKPNLHEPRIFFCPQENIYKFVIYPFFLDRFSFDFYNVKFADHKKLDFCQRYVIKKTIISKCERTRYLKLNAVVGTRKFKANGRVQPSLQKLVTPEKSFFEKAMPVKFMENQREMRT